MEWINHRIYSNWTTRRLQRKFECNISSYKGNKQKKSLFACMDQYCATSLSTKFQTLDLLTQTDKRRRVWKLNDKEDQNWKKDVMWMIEYAANKSVVPSCVGWNSIVILISKHIHQVWYLPQISLRLLNILS